MGEKIVQLLVSAAAPASIAVNACFIVPSWNAARKWNPSKRQKKRGRFVEKVFEFCGFTVDKSGKRNIIKVSVQKIKAMRKPVLQFVPSERGVGASPLFITQDSHFRAVRDERNGSSPLLDG